MTRFFRFAAPITGTIALAALASPASRAHLLEPQSLLFLQAASPSGEHLLKMLGQALESKSRADAEVIARRYLAAVGDGPKARLVLGVTFAQQRFYADAAAHFARARRQAPGNYVIDFNLGLALFRSERLQEAAAVLEQTAAYEDRPELRHLLADVYEESGRHIDALREYEKAVRLAPGNEAYWFALSYELLKHRTYDGASATLESAVRTFPRSFRLRLALGLTYFARRQYDSAVESLIVASDLEPAAVGPYRILAAACSNRSRWGPAVLDRFRRLMEVDPSTPWGPYLQALALEGDSSLRSAPSDTPPFDRLEELYRMSIALDPGFAEAHYRLGRLYRKQGRLSDATDELEAAIQGRNEFAEAHYELARVHLQLGRKVRAEEELQKHRELIEVEREQSEQQAEQVQQFILLLED